MKKEDNGTTTGISYGGRIKITITDGDYTLREGVDYETFLGDGNCKIVDRFSIIAGMGKYEKLLLCGSELVMSTQALFSERSKEIEALLDLIRDKGNVVFY